MEEKQTFLVKKTQLGQPIFLQLTLAGDTVSREYGHVGSDNIQSTANTCTGVNIGKANEKSPEQVAEEEYLRLIKTKTKEGYIEVPSLDDLSILDQTGETLDLDNIPESFCISKPTKTISIPAINKLLKSGNGKFFVKYNGIGHFILIRTDGDIRIFTRRWCDHTLKYPSIVEEVKSQKYPNGTLFYSEFMIDPQLQIPHMTAFLLMSQISKADVADGVCKDEVPKSLALQEKHRVRAALLTILYCDGKLAASFPYQTILNSLNLKSPDISAGKSIFVPKEVPIKSGEEATRLARENKEQIEGFVLWDTTKCVEITMNGKPNRCAAFKVKPQGDTDVIADGYAPGKGRFQGLVGSLKICQYDATGNRIDLGTVGGLTDADRDPDSWQFPCVIEVKYDQRFPDTGKFQFPRFSKRHEDKQPADVELFTN